MFIPGGIQVSDAHFDGTGLLEEPKIGSQYSLLPY